MRKTLSIVAAACVAFLLVGGVGQATPDDTPGPTKPVAEQNLDGNGFIKVHEQGVASVDVQNSNLDVTVSNDELNIGGTVNVGNFPAIQAVSGTVDIGNLPSTQDVNIVGGSMAAQAVTNARQLIFSMADTGVEEQSFPVMAVSSITVTSAFEDYEIHGHSPLSGQDLYLAFESGGDHAHSKQLSFPNPLPLDSIKMICAGECHVTVMLAGF